VHATVFHALGLPLDAHLIDLTGRPHSLTDGRVLPLFGWSRESLAIGGAAGRMRL